ncbi:MAG TPA: UvrD-helicase domain-containing protein, partial [Saprospiraceae bacterium]|nr:UvrD-helicase domain-containing protein [Saprospiraceae bacterium]
MQKLAPYLDELNPIQRQAVACIEGPCMVIAGPGSGKTRVLTYRIAHMILSGIQPGQIMALTFTNKA